jgi:hypothetical protein
MLPAASRPFVDYFAEDKFNQRSYIRVTDEKPAKGWFQCKRPAGLLTWTP